MPTIKEQKEKRAGLVIQMRALLDAAAKDTKGVLTAAQETNYVALETEVDTIGKAVDREDSLATIENTLRNRKDHNYRPVLNKDGKPVKIGRKPLPENYAEAMFNGVGSYSRVGRNGVSPDFMNVLNEGNDTQGGYLVPEEFETKLVENLVNADPIRASATVITTAGDRNIPIETDSGSFTYIGEGTDYPTSDPAIGKAVLSAFKAGGIVKVSEELLQDSFFDLESYLLRLASRRYNTLEQSGFANGGGVAGPLGIFNSVSVGGTTITGTTGAVSASAAITGDNLIDTFHGLARAYRDNAAWLTSDTMVKLIRKLKDSTGQYLWQPGLQAGQPDRLLNRPVLVSDGAPAPAPDQRSIVFGDLSFYYIVDRLGLSMQVLRELYAAQGQVGFKFTKRNDGRLTSAVATTFFTHGSAS